MISESCMQESRAEFESSKIAAGHLTAFGWVGKWNTTSVANGPYSLQSIVYDAGGASRQHELPDHGQELTAAESCTFALFVPLVAVISGVIALAVAIEETRAKPSTRRVWRRWTL
jgi:hypothetical protein